MKFSICNLGCKVNAFEAESIASVMEGKGWTRVPFEEAADAVLIFTCAVTNMAASKSRKMMHRARRLNKDAIICMTGCYAEVDEGMLEDAEIIAGTRYKKNVPLYIDAYMQNHEKIRVRGELEHIPFDNMEAEQFENRTRAYLKVQDGCNQFCSYCIIPYARGRERSMEPDLVIAEAKRLAANYPEIVLAGIHTGRYGREYGLTLAQLMKRILEEVPALQRLRISSIEMTEIDDEMIELIKHEPRIARHLHIPLQSGCDSVLRRMNRPYTTDQYYDKITMIRHEIEDIAISCDLITGFPMESEEEFQQTCDFLNKCGFSFLHVFPYSVRKGTPAATMQGQIDPRIKKERTKICMDISKHLEVAYMQSYLNKDTEVIFETEEDGYVKGHSSQYFPVYAKDVPLHRGVERVKLVKFEDGKLFGELV